MGFFNLLGVYMPPTLENFLAHAKIFSTDEAELALCQLYLDAAIDYIEKYLRVGFTGEKAIMMPPAVRLATLMLASDSYEHREAQSEITLTDNRYVDNLLHPFRDYYETLYNAENWRGNV
jgi:hypothetical protein